MKIKDYKSATTSITEILNLLANFEAIEIFSIKDY